MIMTARKGSKFDEGSIVQMIEQNESDSYFKGIGIFNGKVIIVDRVFFDELDFHDESAKFLEALEKVNDKYAKALKALAK